MPITTSYGMSYGWTKNSIAPSRFSIIPRCFFCKIYKADYFGSVPKITKQPTVFDK